MRFPHEVAVLTVALSCLTAGACSSPPPLQPKDGPALPGTGDGGPGAGRPDLSPVPAPAGLFAKARARNVAATLSAAGTMAGAGDLDKLARAALAEMITGKRSLRLDVDGRKLADAVALEAPVDLVVAMNEGSRPDPMIAFSIGLKSMDEARAAAGANAAEVSPGTFAIGGQKARWACVITPSAGASPARLVCGQKDAHVEILAPYLVRTVAVEPPGAADVVASIDIASLDARFGADARRFLGVAPGLAVNQWGLGEQTFDEALREGTRALVGETDLLLGDLDKVTLQAKVDPQAGVLVSGAVAYRDTKSWIAGTTAATPASAPPAAFFRLPKDADEASFSTLSDPSPLKKAGELGAKMIAGALASEKIGSDAERKKLAALAQLPFVGKGTSFVSASGTGHLTKPAAPKTPAEKWAHGLDAQLGWRLFGIGAPPADVIKWVKDAAAAYSQPGIQAGVKKAAGAGPVGIPTLKTPAAPAKLGKGAFAVEITLPADSANKDLKTVFHVLAMPDGDTTWLAIGTNRDELVERLLTVKVGSPKEGSLEARADLAPMRSGSQAATFFSARSFQTSLLPWLMLKSGSNEKPEEQLYKTATELEAKFNALPHKGRAPAFVRLSSSKGAASKPVGNVEISLPKSTLEDVIAAIRSLRM